MALNDKYFAPPEATETLLRVRGFSPNGLRSGGIETPQIVNLPAGTCSGCITTRQGTVGNGGLHRANSP